MTDAWLDAPAATDEFQIRRITTKRCEELMGAVCQHGGRLAYPYSKAAVDSDAGICVVEAIGSDFGHGPVLTRREVLEFFTVVPDWHRNGYLHTNEEADALDADRAEILAMIGMAPETKDA